MRVSFVFSCQFVVNIKGGKNTKTGYCNVVYTGLRPPDQSFLCRAVVPGGEHGRRELTRPA